MTLLKNCIISLSFLFTILLPVKLAGQDIFDANHSREFAQYLMQSQQYQMAAAEWERVLFFNSGDTLARLSLIRSFRLSDNPIKGWNKINAWYPETLLSRPFSLEAVRLTLMMGNFSSFNSVLDRSPELSYREKSEFQLGAWLMEGSWIEQRGKFRTPGFAMATADVRLLDLYEKTQAIHRKSPGLSVALSTFVPGLGKIYTSDWKDGLISLLFVATNAWQSYRGFSKNGITSVTGWIFGGLTAGFYTANLFGSWKSAKTYNAKQTDLIRHEAEGILFSR